MSNQKYKQAHLIVAALTCIISFAVYLSTMAPTLSFWDCGEFIATSYILGVPHPPGTPLYLILGRFFSLLPFDADIGFRVNLLSPIFSALTVMLLYLASVKLINKYAGKIDNIKQCLITLGSSFVGALTFAFTDSHWFNAVEAEIYAISIFFTALIVWLILVWEENSNKQGNERYLLLIAYAIGLSTGFHLLNLLTIPFVALVIYFKKFKFQWKTLISTFLIAGFTFIIIHNGIIKGIPKLVGIVGIFGLTILVATLVYLTHYFIKSRNSLLSLSLLSLILVIIGYSSYITIFIRADQNPRINENHPNTIQAAVSYLERKQFGDIYQFPRKYNKMPPKHIIAGYPQQNRKFSTAQNLKYKLHAPEKQWDFFTEYQINKMYNRYFLWQFAGRGPSVKTSNFSFGANSKEDGVDFKQFGFPFALFLGLFGLSAHFYKDKKSAFTILILFLATGFALILYLNQHSPQPRERDYSYVGSFFAFSIWISIGIASLTQLISNFFKSEKIKQTAAGLLIVMLCCAMPIIMAKENYKSHSRKGNFVVWDYGYNLLQSCEPNAILFTHGDNDTFPLWYLQEVEGIRKDVIVINLNFLNTPWYLRQLQQMRPADKPASKLSEMQIRQLTGKYTAWKPQEFRINVDHSKNKNGYIKWQVNPTYAGKALKPQDVMILHILKTALKHYPIYFAITVPQQKRMIDKKFLELEGMVYKVTKYESTGINHEKLEKNLVTKMDSKFWNDNFSRNEWNKRKNEVWSTNYKPGYLFRNLGNENVYYNPRTKRLLQSYRSLYMQLAISYLKNNEHEKVKQVFNSMKNNMPEQIIEAPSKRFVQHMINIQKKINDQENLQESLRALLARTDLNTKERSYYAQMLNKIIL